MRGLQASRVFFVSVPRPLPYRVPFQLARILPCMIAIHVTISEGVEFVMWSKVLICEDERFIHELIQETLRKGGVETLSAYTGADAVRLASEGHPQAILLDMTLPDMDGAQILSAIRAQRENQHTPVIVLSATPKEELEGKLAEFSVTTYLSKPFNPDDLLAQLQKTTTGIAISSRERPLILVVEDSHVHQKVIGRFLEDNDFQPIFAESVKQAIQVLSTFTPQAIILDLLFPGESGIEVLEELKARRETIPVIVASSIVDKRILCELSAYKVNSVLTKPIVLARLREKLDEIFTPQENTSDQQGATGREIRILLVEDFLLTLRATEKALIDMGFQVISASDGASALSLLSSHPVDLIALDVAMPGMNGVEFLETVRRWGMDTPCVVVSGNIDSKKKVDLQQLGVEKFFTKPLNFEEFGNYVNESLRGVGSSTAKASPYDVLIAMSSDQAAHLVNETIRAMGYTTQVVNDGFLALAELRRRPKLTIFDVVLGGMDGPELVRRVGPLDHQRARLLALAEYLDEEMEKELEKLGIDAALRKPFQREELTRKVTELMSGFASQLTPSAFVDEFQRLLDEIPRESDKKYWTKVRTLGHNLQGSAMYIDRADLASLGQQIEGFVTSGDQVAAVKALDEIRNIFQEIRESLNQSESNEKPLRSDEIIVE